MLGVLILAGLVGRVWAQTADPGLTFEVASIKPAAPQGNGRMMVGARGGPGTVDPGRYSTFNMPLKLLLTQAYGVRDFQISGPGWLDTERFDITAKVPPGTTKDQFKVMLQNLLAERFKMEVHREQKDLPLYTLSVGKGGPKLKETELDPGALTAPMNDGSGPGRGGAQSVPLPPPRPGEFPKLPAGRPGMLVMFAEGHLRMTAVGQGVSNLADFLSTQLGRPVVDKTGLTGKYDFQMDFAPEPGQGPMRGMALGPPPPGAGGGGEGSGPAASVSEPGAPNLITAVQQLGFKLDSGKGPVDLIVIDKAEKVPTEN